MDYPQLDRVGRDISFPISGGGEGDCWQQLNLSNEEDTKIIVNEDQLKKEINKDKNSIIGRLHAERSISKEILKTSMKI